MGVAAGDIDSGTLAGARLADKHKRIVYPMYIGDVTAADDFLLGYVFDAFTIEEVFGETDAGTFTFNIYQRNRGTGFSGGTKVITAELVADATAGTEVTSGWNDNTVQADVWLYVVASAMSGATKCAIYVTGTIDD